MVTNLRECKIKKRRTLSLTGVLTFKILGREIFKRTDFVYMHGVSIALGTFAGYICTCRDRVHVHIIRTCVHVNLPWLPKCMHVLLSRTGTRT